MLLKALHTYSSNSISHQLPYSASSSQQILYTLWSPSSGYDGAPGTECSFPHYNIRNHVSFKAQLRLILANIHQLLAMLASIPFYR